MGLLLLCVTLLCAQRLAKAWPAGYHEAMQVLHLSHGEFDQLAWVLSSGIHLKHSLSSFPLVVKLGTAFW
jgi:hypothetical protein